MSLYFIFSPNSFFLCVFYKSIHLWKIEKKSSSFNSDNSEAFPWAEHVAVFQKKFLGNQGRYKMTVLVIHAI